MDGVSNAAVQRRIDEVIFFAKKFLELRRVAFADAGDAADILLDELRESSPFFQVLSAPEERKPICYEFMDSLSHRLNAEISESSSDSNRERALIELGERFRLGEKFRPELRLGFGLFVAGPTPPGPENALQKPTTEESERLRQWQRREDATIAEIRARLEAEGPKLDVPPPKLKAPADPPVETLPQMRYHKTKGAQRFNSAAHEAGVTQREPEMWSDHPWMEEAAPEQSEPPTPKAPSVPREAFPAEPDLSWLPRVGGAHDQQVQVTAARDPVIARIPRDGRSPKRARGGRSRMEPVDGDKAKAARGGMSQEEFRRIKLRREISIDTIQKAEGGLASTTTKALYLKKTNVDLAITDPQKNQPQKPGKPRRD